MSNTKNLANLAAALDDGTSGQVLQSTGSGGVQFADSTGSGVTVHANQAAMLTDAASASEGTLHYETGTNKLYVKQSSGFYLLASITNVAPTIDSFSENTGGAGANNLTSGGTFTLTAGSNTVVTISATEPDLETISYSATVTSGTATDVFSSPSFPVTNQSSNVFTLTPVTSGSGGTVTIRFDASDGTNVANVTHSFTLEFFITDSHYTSLLVATDAASGDNNDITDSSSNAYTITASGDAHAGTFSPYRHGGYSTYFDGSGDYLTANAALSSLTSTSNSFTIEGFFNADDLGTTSSSSVAFIGINRTSSGANQIILGPRVLRYNATSDVYTYTGASTSVWHHFAFVYDGSEAKYYLDGTLKVTISSALNTALSDCTLMISAEADSANAGSPGNYFNGYISDLRIVGSAVYTSAFTPPTERLTAITNTKLLTCHLPYISDGSSSAHTITVNGNTSTEPFGPYDYSEYSESDNGGSLYFDGTGDYVRISSIADLSSGSWTIEGWYYFEADPNSSATCFWALNTSSVNGYAFLLTRGNDPTIFSIQQRGTGTYTSEATYDFDVNRWYHIATVWDNSASTLKIYINGKEEVSGTANPIQNAGNGLTLGADGYGSSLITGFVSDFRIKQTAEYTAEFTPPTAPLSSSGTVLHIKGTDAHVIDKSQGNNLKLVGNAAAVTSATNNSNISSTNAVYFDGSGDYLTTPDDAVFDFGSGEWTVECWFYRTGGGNRASQVVYNQSVGGASSNSAIFLGAGSDGMSIYLSTSGSAWTNNIVTSVEPTVNTWVHCVWQRRGNTLEIYLDGSLQTVTGGSSSFTGTIYNSSLSVEIGSQSAGSYLTGYIQDLRVTKGLARYTSNFTVPSAHLKG